MFLIMAYQWNVKIDKLNDEHNERASQRAVD